MQGRLERRSIRRVESWGCAFGLVALSSALIAGCFGQAAQENQRLLQQQQAELEQMQRDLATLQAQTGGVSPAPVPGPPPANVSGACDSQLAQRAAQQGAREMKAGDLKHALSYYQDAATACPKNADIELKLGQVYEAMGQRAFAREHYRRAEVLAIQDNPALADRARKALAHLEPQQ
jgi:tetratricopeptide (TPR) repeat protein